MRVLTTRLTVLVLAFVGLPLQIFGKVTERLRNLVSRAAKRPRMPSSALTLHCNS